MSDFIRIDQYTVIKVEDSGQYGFKLIEGWEGRDGDFKPNFCKREFKKGSGEKTVPVSIKLGDLEHAEAALITVLQIITGKEYMYISRTGKAQPNPILEDVPF